MTDLFKLLSKRTVPLLTAKPTISVDYLAEYNKITKPTNYDPNENAAVDYEKAFDAFVDTPEVVKEFQQAWPGNMNKTEFGTLKNWLSSNIEALGYLRQAAQKPYCWIERHATDDAIFNIKLPELPKLRESVWCVSLQAKLTAWEGRAQQAFEQVIELYKVGAHYAGPITLVEQLVGTAICQIAFDTAFAILDREKIDSDNMANFHCQLDQQLQQVKHLNFSTGERIYCLDIIQRVFTDDGNSEGRLIPGKLFKFMKGSLSPISYYKAILISVDHPGRRETRRSFKELYRNLDGLSSQAPWQLRRAGTNYEEQIRRLTKDNYLLSSSVFSMGKVCEIYQRKNMAGKALLATLALFRYKTDKGNFPGTLQDVITTGYLKDLPIDYYSGKPLVYRPGSDDFTLYNLGANFTDNGGTISEWGEADQVFWPVERC